MFTITPIKGYIDSIDGFYCDGVNVGMKTTLSNEKRLTNDPDVGFIYSDTLCQVEAIFTTNKFQAAPLKHYQSYTNDFKTNFVLVNSKNANAMTGKEGIDDISEILNSYKVKFKKIQNPIMSSTGVIGVRIPKDKIISAKNIFDLSSKNGQNLSKAIMTTDAYPKISLYEVKLQDGTNFKIGSVAKGAGMINPSLATMLCFICTDASIPKAHMKELLIQTSKTTFNAISVDGDTSTNDTVMLLANQKSNSYNKVAFKEALRLVMNDMAMLIVADGEGAKKVVAFNISGALDDKEAEKTAKYLSNSLLVKTALFGEDPNWGRIASTIASSGVDCCEDSLSIAFGNILVYDKGNILFTSEIEQKASTILQADQFTIFCNLGIANGKFTAYGCDLGYEYIKINADYRT
jgi:glutamate N-acetyltransferase/amino-acid N-acetyltransferase